MNRRPIPRIRNQSMSSPPRAPLGNLLPCVAAVALCLTAAAPRPAGAASASRTVQLQAHLDD